MSTKRNLFLLITLVISTISHAALPDQNKMIEQIIAKKEAEKKKKKLIKYFVGAALGVAACGAAAYYYYNKHNAQPHVKPNQNIQPAQLQQYVYNDLIKIVRSDITKLQFKDPEHAAIVNAANNVMLGGGGIDGAIHQAAGPGLRAECALSPETRPGNNVRCPTGQARITGGHNLAPLRIIHTVGPNLSSNKLVDGKLLPTDKQKNQLQNCYLNSLGLAQANNITAIAFPAISTSIYAYDIKLAVAVAVDAVLDYIKKHPDAFKEIIFVLFSEKDFNIYVDYINKK